jgi:hypothetical protein
MQYLLLIYNDAESAADAEEWQAFFTRARASGLFVGGSELVAHSVVGDAAVVTDAVVGYMRFDTADDAGSKFASDKEALLQLLTLHPVVAHGGTVQLLEMPRSPT